jgi:hypothetical protein
MESFIEAKLVESDGRLRVHLFGFLADGDDIPELPDSFFSSATAEDGTDGCLVGGYLDMITRPIGVAREFLARRATIGDLRQAVKAAE